MVRWFSFHGQSLAVRFDTAALDAAASVYLRWFSIPPGERAPAAQFTIDVTYRATGHAAPPNLPVIARGRLPAGPEWVVYSAGARRCVDLIGRTRVTIDTVAARGRVEVEPGQEGWTVDGGILPVLHEWLGLGGQHALHAAAVELGADGPGSAVLVVGHSGAGKTTTALALARFGWPLVTDDLIFICHDPSCDADPPAVWGWPSLFKVRPRTVELMPWLESLGLEATAIPGARHVPRQSLGRAAVADPTHLLRPAMVLFMAPPNGEGHRLRALDKAAALVRLCEENVRPIERAGDRRAGGAFAAFGALVRSCPTWELSAGPDLAGLGPLVAERLEGDPS